MAEQADLIPKTDKQLISVQSIRLKGTRRKKKGDVKRHSEEMSI